jgi:hypothetical protein
MNNFEENALRIANYLEDKMSSSEEEAFMRELETNETLRRQYEDELLVKTLLQNQKQESGNADNLPFQSADEHLNMIEAALEKKVQPKNKAPVVKLFRNYKFIVAASLIIILLSVVFLLLKKNSDRIGPVDKTLATKDSIRTDDSIVNRSRDQAGIDERPVVKDSSGKAKPSPKKEEHVEEQLAEKNALKDSTNTDSTVKLHPYAPTNFASTAKVFEDFYSAYKKSDKDPAEIGDYYTSYDKGNYDKVLSSTDTAYQLMGTSARSNLLKQYMDLYKGLSYLAESRSMEAIQKFDLVLQSSLKTSRQYYEAQWYSVLAWLKDNNPNKAAAIAQNITQTTSPYRLRAVRLLEELTGK